MESIKELRSICQSTAKKDKSNYYMRYVSRFLSIYFTRIILPTSITPNQVSFAMIATGILACTFFLSSQSYIVLFGALILQAWYILDCMDGEVARYRKFQKTGQEVIDKSDLGLTGMYYDVINHYIINLLVPITMSYGLFKATDESGWIIFGMMGSVTQILMLSMHHAQESTLLRKINSNPSVLSFNDASIKSEPAAKEQLSLPHRLFSMLHYSMTYPSMMNLVLLFSLFELITGSILIREAFLIFTALGSLIVTLAVISKKIKHRDPDKQFANLFSIRKD
jgi:hypothetical protein